MNPLELSTGRAGIIHNGNDYIINAGVLLKTLERNGSF
jgi:hypothetical protein